MKFNITDIILIILIIGVLYLLFSTDKEDFTNDNDIISAVDEEINKRYTVDLENMRILNGVASNILTNIDELNITQTNTKLFNLTTNDTNINTTLTTTDMTILESGATVEGTFEADDTLKTSNVRVKNNIKINLGKYNDILPKGSIILFYTKNGEYNIPYGWAPCDGSYYDAVKAPSDNNGKDPDGKYTKFYKVADKQPTSDNSLIRNVDLANTWRIDNMVPDKSGLGINRLMNLYNISLDTYSRLYGINNEFTDNDNNLINDYNIQYNKFINNPKRKGFFEYKQPNDGVPSPKKIITNVVFNEYIYIIKII